jgi:hypothetical protein
MPRRGSWSPSRRSPRRKGSAEPGMPRRALPGRKGSAEPGMPRPPQHPPRAWLPTVERAARSPGCRDLRKMGTGVYWRMMSKGQRGARDAATTVIIGKGSAEPGMPRRRYPRPSRRVVEMPRPRTVSETGPPPDVGRAARSAGCRDRAGHYQRGGARRKGSAEPRMPRRFLVGAVRRVSPGRKGSAEPGMSRHIRDHSSAKVERAARSPGCRDQASKIACSSSKGQRGARDAATRRMTCRFAMAARLGKRLERAARSPGCRDEQEQPVDQGLQSERAARSPGCRDLLPIPMPRPQGQPKGQRGAQDERAARSPGCRDYPKAAERAARSPGCRDLPNLLVCS